MSVLLVEDSAVLAERLREMLTGLAGLTLTDVVDSEAAALKSLAEQVVDVVVLDLHLRQGTGLGVLRQISLQPRRPVVIVFTNYGLEEYRRAAAALGAQHFLDKARDFDQLPAILEEIRDRTVG